MTVPTRALTFNFQKSVSQASGIPATLEVAVAPLAVSSSPNLNSTLIGPTQTQSVILSTDVSVVFHLVPTDYPELTARVPYRAAWREKYMGKQYTYDFVMPDADVDFDDLHNLGNIIGGESYLQWPDRGRPEGVAGLNDQGQVIDAFGVVIHDGKAQAAIVQHHLDAEIAARKEADELLKSQVIIAAEDQISLLYTTIMTSMAIEVSALENADAVEKKAREQGDALLTAQMIALQNATNAQFDEITGGFDGVDEQLAAKADLVDGKILDSQIPELAISRAVLNVTSDQGMTQLTNVQQGDFAVRPDGVWMLNGDDPSVLENWVEFTTPGMVVSVNGESGEVDLDAADVGARPLDELVPQDQVDGLPDALLGKADVSLVGRVEDIETDLTYVKTEPNPDADGALEIPKDDSGSYLVYLNESGQLTDKAGGVLNVGGGGGLIGISDVQGLEPILLDNALTETSDHDGRLTTHGGYLTNHDGRITTLENLVAGGGGGTGGADITKANWYYSSSVDPILGQSSPAGFEATVDLRGPFSRTGSDPATYTYNYHPDGVAAQGDTYVYAYVSPNGHLELREWDETGLPDPPAATQSDLDALEGIVEGLTEQVGNQPDLGEDGKIPVDQIPELPPSQITGLEDTLDDKADLDDTDKIPVGQIPQLPLSQVDGLTGALGDKADDTDLLLKADLEEDPEEPGTRTVLQVQIPDGIPQAKIDGLVTALESKLELSETGTVDLEQIPQNIPQNYVVGLVDDLASKADLINDKLDPAQIPPEGLASVTEVPNKPAMLDLVPQQVQPGDTVVITGTDDRGTYMLKSPVASETTVDPSVEGNWVKLPVPYGLVEQVSTPTGIQTGPIVVLDAAAVGARPEDGDIPLEDVVGPGDVGLDVILTGIEEDIDAVEESLLTKITEEQAKDLVSAAQQNKLQARLVATTNVSRIGQASVDGQTPDLGDRVLLTGQTEPKDNGLYEVVESASGTWPRVPDMDTDSYFIKGSIVTVGARDAHNPYTTWQEIAETGLVGHQTNHWMKIVTSAPPVPLTASRGVMRVDNDFRADLAKNGGIILNPDPENSFGPGLMLDKNLVARKKVKLVGGGASVPVQHDLNTQDLVVSFRNVASGDYVLVGWKPDGYNRILVDFGVSQAKDTYQATIIG